MDKASKTNVKIPSEMEVTPPHNLLSLLPLLSLQKLLPLLPLLICCLV